MKLMLSLVEYKRHLFEVVLLAPGRMMIECDDDEDDDDDNAHVMDDKTDINFVCIINK